MKVNEIAKRSLGLLLIFSMVLGGLYINDVSVKAEETLKANKEVKGTISEGQSVSYNFIMPKKGYFSFRVSSSRDFLRVTMKENYKTWESYEILNSGTPYTSSCYSFKPGTKVQITITSTNSFYDPKDYTLCVNVKSVANFESEDNNKRTRANTIKLKKTYTGLIMKEDADWYVFKAPKKGKYKISGVNVTRDYVRAATYKGYKEIAYNELKEGDGYKTLFSGKLKKGQKIYLKVYYDSLFEARGVFYKIKVKKK